MAGDEMSRSASGDVQPQPLAATPALPQWPEPVSHGPEFAGAASFIPVEAMSVR